MSSHALTALPAYPIDASRALPAGNRPTRIAVWLHFRFAALSVLLFLLAGLALPARADNDAVEFFNNADVAQGQSAHDVVVFFGNANIDGTVTGDVVVIFGNVNLHGAANHDVVNIFGNTHMYDGTSIGHDVVHIFGNIHMGENTSIGKDSVVIFGGLHAPASASFGGNRVVQPAWLFFIPVLILALIIRGIFGAVRYPRRRYYQMRGY